MGTGKKCYTLIKKNVGFKLDSGADLNVLPFDILSKC